MLKSSSRNALTFLDYFTIESKNLETFQTILRDIENNKLILMKQIENSSPEQATQTANTLSIQKKLNHEQLLSLLDYYPQPSYNKIIVFYEYCEFSLADQFQSRIDQRRIFQQSELWSILTSLIFGLEYLQVNNIGHGSVSLSDVYLNDCGFVKICDPTLASSNPFIFTQGKYYSPELLDLFRTNQPFQINIFRSDVFCLGCCIIQLTLMRNILPEIIDQQTLEISHQSLNRVLEELQYSDLSAEYVQFVTSMLEIDENSRDDFISLKEKIYLLLNVSEEEFEEFEKQHSKISEIVEMMKGADEKSMRNSLQRSLSKEQFVSSAMNYAIHSSIKHDHNRMLNSIKRLEQVCVNSIEQNNSAIIHHHQYFEQDTTEQNVKTSHIKFFKEKIITQATLNSPLSFQSTGKLSLNNVKFVVEEESEDQVYELALISNKKTETTVLPINERDLNLSHPFHEGQDDKQCKVSKLKHKKTFSNLMKKPKDQLQNLQNRPVNRLSQPNHPQHNNKPKKLYTNSPYRKQRHSYAKPLQNTNQTIYTDPNFLLMMQNQVSSIMKKRQIRMI